MRKLDEVASSIADNSRVNTRKKSYSLPISIRKLKHLILKPSQEEEVENKMQTREVRMKCAEDELNQQGNYILQVYANQHNH